MSPRKMTSKKASTCVECGKPILPGNSIYWARGRGAWHVNCQTASYANSNCTSCGGSGLRWNNETCQACQGAGTRSDQDRTREIAKRRAAETGPTMGGLDVDLAYEDDCARRCGL